MNSRLLRASARVLLLGGLLAASAARADNIETPTKGVYGTIVSLHGHEVEIIEGCTSGARRTYPWQTVAFNAWCKADKRPPQTPHFIPDGLSSLIPIDVTGVCPKDSTSVAGFVVQMSNGTEHKATEVELPPGGSELQLTLLGGQRKPEPRANVMRIRRSAFCKLREQRAESPSPSVIPEGSEMKVAFPVEGRPASASGQGGAADGTGSRMTGGAGTASPAAPPDPP